MPKRMKNPCQKRVGKKKAKSMENHHFLGGKNVSICVTVGSKRGLARSVPEEEKAWKKHPK